MVTEHMGSTAGNFRPVGWWWPKDREGIVFTWYTARYVVHVLINFS